MSKVGDTFSKAGEMYFNQEYRPVQRIYADLEYLQDLRFGALLNTITDKRELDYIYMKLNDYNNRYDRNLCKYFKALHLNENAIDKLLRGPAKNAICVTAPWTTAYSGLCVALQLLSKHNDALLDAAQPITLVINCADVDYPKILVDKLFLTLKNMFSLQTEFQRIPRYTMSVSEYLSFDMMFLYDYGAFLKNIDIAKAMMEEGKFVDKRIVAHPYIEDKILETENDPEFVLESTEKQINVCCDFSFLRASIDNDK